MRARWIEWLRAIFNKHKGQPLDEPGYRSLLENIPVITYINALVKPNETLYISPQAEQLLGYPRELFLTDPTLWIKLMHPDDTERVLRESDLTNTTFEPFSQEYRLIAKDGHIVWMHDDAVVVRDVDGHPQYWLGVWTDITERKQIEAAEQSSEERYRSFITQSSEGIRGYDLDEPIPVDLPEEEQLARMLKHMYIAECNDAFAHMYGLASGNELIGKRLSAMGLENDPRNMEALRGFIRAKYKVLDVESHEQDVHGREKIFLINTIGVIEGGCLQRVWGTQRDITEQKQIENDLRTSQERYRSFITHSSEGVWRFDHELPISITLPEDEQLKLLFDHSYLAECNDSFARMYGYAHAADLVGRGMTEFVPRHDPENVNYMRQFIRKGYRITDGETHEPDAHNNLRYFLNNTIGIVENGYLIRTWGTQRDITDRKIAEASLRTRETILAAMTFAAERFLTVPDWRRNIDVVLERLGRGLNASHAYIFEHWTVGNERRSSLHYEWTAAGQVPDLGKPKYQNMPVRHPDGDVSYDILKSGQTFLGDRVHLIDEDLKELHIHGLKAVLETPIVVEDVWWGTIGLDDCINDRLWTNSEVDLLRVAANTISAAIQRNQADEEIHKFTAALEQRIADLNAINQISQTLVFKRDLHDLIQTVGEQIRIMYDSPVVYITLLDPQTNLIDFHYQYEQGHFIQGTQIKYGEGMTSRVMQLRRPVLINANWENEAREYDVIREGEPSKSSLTVPLLFGEEAIGTISLQDMERENLYTDDHVRQLTTIAANLVVAIENARLHTKLQAELAERRQAEETVRSLNATLEQRVKERTALLESANKELETFSYSVSHDLRAPLRAIQSFTNLLVRDYGAVLDGEGKGFLDKVIRASSEMNEKIEGLLAFARLTRAGLHPTPLALSALATSVLDGLRAAHPERIVTTHIEAGLTAQGDEVLIRTVLENLLGNAWKYTSRTSQAVIEFGLLPPSSPHHESERPVFFVRDNGAGFNMKYADKLFGAFQRLHRVDEFPGHGIGLATVQRILHRHGGRIWADAKEGQGATFYFTLG